jgi:hypothetical protein
LAERSPLSARLIVIRVKQPLALLPERRRCASMSIEKFVSFWIAAPPFLRSMEKYGLRHTAPLYAGFAVPSPLFAFLRNDISTRGLFQRLRISMN